MLMQMQDGEDKWPPIMTKGHVLHRGPFESGPYNKSTKGVHIITTHTD
jgi:hypothetical protein